MKLVNFKFKKVPNGRKKWNGEDECYFHLADPEHNKYFIKENTFYFIKCPNLNDKRDWYRVGTGYLHCDICSSCISCDFTDVNNNHREYIYAGKLIPWSNDELSTKYFDAGEETIAIFDTKDEAQKVCDELNATRKTIVEKIIIDDVITKYEQAKRDVKYYSSLIRDNYKEFAENNIYGKCFIIDAYDEKYFFYKVKEINLINEYRFELLSENGYKCICKEIELTEHCSDYEWYIRSENEIGLNCSSDGQNIYDYFFNNRSVSIVSEEEFFERLKTTTKIDNIESFPDFSYYKYKDTKYKVVS